MQEGNCILIPNEQGFWRHLGTGYVIEVYCLEPINNTLCIWGPDEGITHIDFSNSPPGWDVEMLPGHIPINVFIVLNYLNDTHGWELI